MLKVRKNVFLVEPKCECSSYVFVVCRFHTEKTTKTAENRLVILKKTFQSIAYTY